MTTPFISDNFLLQTPTAQRLYHDFAANLPIIDYHNHLPPDEVAGNKTFANLTEVWLKGDHYKWRAMRANGVPESHITGAATDPEKFSQWAATVPATLRNPLYHWTHLELQRYFGISELLNATSGPAIYEQASAQLQSPEFTAPNLLRKMQVEVICTTDHPTDSLEHHAAYQAQNDQLKMLPTFRPDKFLVIDGADYLNFLHRLEAIIGTEILTFEDMVSALEKRIDFFAAHGCQVADHGLAQLFAVAEEDFKVAKLNLIMSKVRSQKPITEQEAQGFQMALLHELGKCYHARNWTMQFHLGAIRNNNQRLMHLIGADVGCDSIGDFEQARGLAFFLNRLDAEEKLAKTILYNLNPRDNELFATMAGNYNDGSMAGKIQWGSAWWFLDQKDGMEKQIDALSNLGLLSQFIGMLTDSRSFLSFPRHEYFRRILCNLIGKDVHNGLLPNDLNLLGELVSNVCYGNAQRYFNF